jgi:hypothetical protein
MGDEAPVSLKVEVLDKIAALITAALVWSQLWHGLRQSR